MQHPLRRLRSAAAPVARALSTAAGAGASASRPRWGMIHHTGLLMPPSSPRAVFQLAEPPCASHILVPEHLVDPQPCPPGMMRACSSHARASSGDGLLVLDFTDGLTAAPAAGARGPIPLDGKQLKPDVTRFVCNPLSGELFRVPDIDGTKKTLKWQLVGILTQSDRPNGPPDRYALASFSSNAAADDDDEWSFAVRRFLSQKGEWDEPVVFPSPLPLERPLFVDHDPVTFAGRIWWVDVSWGAISVDPLSDKPELRFVELPGGSVMEPVKDEKRRGLVRYRRLGVSEGRLRYAEASQKEPFVLSSFALDDNGSSWTLEHRVALSRLRVDGGLPLQQEDTPQIGVIDPLNASIMYLKIGVQCISVDMERGKVLGRSLLGDESYTRSCLTALLTPCVLPPWLPSYRIPSAGTPNTKSNIKSKTLAPLLSMDLTHREPPTPPPRLLR
uniref:DUF1618 domain-containing protein n=1 Tax=Oryza meridionalis TaxID=40149 RepID=A0A0E0DNV5_9ORYZ